MNLTDVDSEKKVVLSQWFVLALLLLALFYRVPAYFLEYKWEPPLAFRLGKYLIGLMLALGAIHVWSCRFRELTRYDLLYSGAFTLLAIQGFRTNAWDLVEGGFWPLVSFAVLRFSQLVSVRSISRIVGCAFLAYGIILVIQFVALDFYGYGFMHSGSSVFNSRFGGLTVEPLSAPMLCLVFLGWATGNKRYYWPYVFCAVLFVLMTHTWTSYLYVMIVFGLWGIHKIWHSRYRPWVYGLIILVLFSLLILVSTGPALLATNEFLSGKKTSIALHATYWWPDRWLWLPSDDFIFSETVWVGYVENMGIIWTVWFFGLLFFIAKRVFDGWRSEADIQLRAIKFASLLVTGYFLFGGLNLPYPAIFPANLIFYLFANLVVFEKLRANQD